MHFNPTYEPPKHKIAYKRIFILLFIIVVIGCAYLYIRDYQAKLSEKSYAICGLNNIETRKRITNPEQSYEIKDYLFYGETLNIFAEPYVLNQDDVLYGKSITIKNLCEDYELVYILDRKVDGQIPLEELKPGFYSIYLNQDVQLHQLYTENKINETFYTATRNGINYKIDFFSDKNFFDDPGQESAYLNQSFIYIKVEEAMPPIDYYDIVLDAGHSSKDSGWGIEYGHQVNGMIESDETYRFATTLKTELEALGLKVYLTRDRIDTVIDSYGDKGRLHKAYLNHAKYYIDIQANASSNAKTRGTQVIYSSFASNRFASIINQQILEDTALISTNNQNGQSANGVLPSIKSNGFDGRMMIRESGGRILGAGTYSDAAATNAFFNKDTRFGMQALTIEYFFMSNEEDTKIWKEDLDLIAKATASGFKRYLRIE